MSRNVNADVKRGDVLNVNPYDIIVKEELRGRHRPVSDNAIIEMAVSLAEYGQRLPVECRLTDDRKLLLNLGFTRTNAARLLREGFEYQGVQYHDPDFRIKVLVVKCDEARDFINNVVENAHRNETTPVDDAFNQQKLREVYGFKDADIARLYRMNPAKVSHLRQLLQLEPNILDLVHHGQLPLVGAIDLLEVGPEERQKIIKEVEKDGKIKGASVRESIRNRVINDDEQDEVPPKKAKARSLSEIRKLFRTWGEGRDAQMAKLGEVLLRWSMGEIGDKTLRKHVLAVLNETFAEEEAA